MANLVETILSNLPGNSGEMLGAAFGEQPDNMVKGLSGILPLLLSAFAGKAATGADLGGLTSLLQGALAGGNPLDNPGALLGGSPPSDGIGALASQLLGSNFGPVAATVASFFGLKGGTVQSLMSLAGPLIAGGVGKALGVTPTVDGLRRLLVSEKDSYEAALPGELRALVSPPVVTATPPPTSSVPPRKSTSWMWIAVLGLLFLAILAWLIFGLGDNSKQLVLADRATPESEVVETVPVVPAGAGVLTEDRAGLPALLVFFDVGASEVSADLAPSSADVQAYLNANADSRLSVSGYNDPTGDAAANEALALSRAEAVRDALVAAGVAADRIDLDRPADNTDTSDSYAAARRVEVTIKP